MGRPPGGERPAGTYARTIYSRLRRIPVGIDGTVYHPLEVPQLIEAWASQTRSACVIGH
jgi:hypothetical protein